MTSVPADTSSTGPLEGVRVLLVDDSPDQQRLYLLFLQQAGASVTLECNGISAVRRLEQEPDVYDSVVMDFMMPEMDGIQATIAMRARGFQGKIIGFTANGRSNLRNEWLQAGCDTFLLKPLTRETLTDTLELLMIPTSSEE